MSITINTLLAEFDADEPFHASSVINSLACGNNVLRSTADRVDFTDGSNVILVTDSALEKIQIWYYKKVE